MSRRLAAMLAAVLMVLASLLIGAPPAAAAPGPSDAPEYWFDSWHVMSLWQHGARGQGITIGEIDSGVNASVPELRGRVLNGKDFGRGGSGHVDRDRDRFGHGTAMASIMVGRPGLFDITGLAPGAKILPVAVPLLGTTDQDAPENLPGAIRYAADHGAKIINMSLGGRRSTTVDGDQSCPADEQAAVFHAIAKGVIVVASVGNTGPRANTVEEPGVCLGVVSVGAIDESGHIAHFSARQPYLTLVAPGVRIPSIGRVPGQAFEGGGTSQASAMVSASLALVWSKYPKLTARQVVARLLATLDSPHRTPSSTYGYGNLDAGEAVTATVPTDAPNPVWSKAQPFLAQSTAYGKSALGHAPPSTVNPKQSYGPYDVGSGTRFTSEVIIGMVVGLAGLVALVLLLGYGWRRRRHGRPVVEVPLPPWTALSAVSTVSTPSTAAPGATSTGEYSPPPSAEPSLGDPPPAEPSPADPSPAPTPESSQAEASSEPSQAQSPSAPPPPHTDRDARPRPSPGPSSE